MAYSYKTYSETSKVMRKYVNATEGAIIYSISRNRLTELARKAGAIHKVGNSSLINTETFEKYLEQFHERAVPMPKHVFENPEKYET